MVDRAARYGLLTEISTLNAILEGPSTPTSLPKLENAIQRLQNGLLSARETIKSFFWNLQIKGLWGMWSNREKKISIHREPRELIKSAMRKLHKGRPITVREAQGLNVLWHEIGHSQGSQSMPGYSYELNNPMTFAVEAVNEMHARLTLDRFIRQLGFDPRLVPINDVLNAPGIVNLSQDWETSSS
ncbi:MAG: hypothetical protein D6723_06850 [Acidobacteria bacterium]|nr:MAG: hypothetical protein D6723_06850 [Acidobacteriota bacterium]